MLTNAFGTEMGVASFFQGLGSGSKSYLKKRLVALRTRYEIAKKTRHLCDLEPVAGDVQKLKLRRYGDCQSRLCLCGPSYLDPTRLSRTDNTVAERAKTMALSNNRKQVTARRPGCGKLEVVCHSD